MWLQYFNWHYLVPWGLDTISQWACFGQSGWPLQLTAALFSPLVFNFTLPFTQAEVDGSVSDELLPFFSMYRDQVDYSSLRLMESEVLLDGQTMREAPNRGTLVLLSPEQLERAGDPDYARALLQGHPGGSGGFPRQYRRPVAEKLGGLYSPGGNKKLYDHNGYHRGDSVWIYLQILKCARPYDGAHGIRKGALNANRKITGTRPVSAAEPIFPKRQQGA